MGVRIYRVVRPVAKKLSTCTVCDKVQGRHKNGYIFNLFKPLAKCSLGDACPSVLLS